MTVQMPSEKKRLSRGEFHPHAEKLLRMSAYAGVAIDVLVRDFKDEEPHIRETFSPPCASLFELGLLIDETLQGSPSADERIFIERLMRRIEHLNVPAWPE